MKAGELVECRACPAMMRAAQMPSGSMNPLDLDEIPLDVVLEGAKGVVAYFDGRGRSVTKAARAAGEPQAWAAKGATFHVSHFATCPERHRFKKDAT